MEGHFNFVISVNRNFTVTLRLHNTWLLHFIPCRYTIFPKIVSNCFICFSQEFFSIIEFNNIRIAMLTILNPFAYSHFTSVHDIHPSPAICHRGNVSSWNVQNEQHLRKHEARIAFLVRENYANNWNAVFYVCLTYTKIVYSSKLHMLTETVKYPWHDVQMCAYS